MKVSPRLSLLLLLLGLLFCLGILFRPYLLEYVVQPIAILFLYLWRIILSVHAAVYWSILIFSVSIYASYQLFFRRLQKPAVPVAIRPSASNATLENVRYWRTMILVTRDEIEKPSILKSELREMLVSMLAAKQPGSSTLEMYNALRLHKILLPEDFFTFLFPEELPLPRRHFKQTLYEIWNAPLRWAGHGKARELAKYYRSIEQVIAYLESSMEIKNDSEPIEPLKY
jgi:hypothetical protein